jgi:hypothetical protein
MKIFKLDRLKWYESLTQRQKTKSVKMLKDRLSLSRAELREQFLSKRVVARKPYQEEIKQYQEFIDALINKSKSNSIESLINSK